MAALERHYSIQEIAKMWSMSPASVRRMFADVAGVLRVGSEERRFKRGYVTLRIPESVLQKFHAEHRKVTV